MTVDFRLKRAPAYRIAYVAWKGPWSDATIRRNFEKVARWAASKGYRTGPWVFLEPGSRRWLTGVVVPGNARGDGAIRLRTLPARRVASVEFDPDVVSPRVVYHGLSDWLRGQKKDREIRSVGAYREVYRGNPWTDPRAYAHTDIQVVVRP